MQMRYYEYISESKVDMLYPQVGTPAGTTTTEVGIDLKVAKASRKSERVGQPTIYDKLEAIENWIYTHEAPGSIDEPGSWVYGQLPLATVVPTGADAQSSGIDGAILFVGCTEDGSYLMLSGSMRHLITHGDKSGYAEAKGSALWWIERTLGPFADELDPGTVARSRSRADRAQPPSDGMSHGALVWQVTSWALSERPTLVVREFLAKRLHSNVDDYGNTYCLATPLFVAFAD